VSEFALIPSGGGVFEVMVGDDLIYSKKQTGQHPDFDDVVADVRKKLSPTDSHA
jgi:selenoprotein W-related protein